MEKVVDLAWKSCEPCSLISKKDLENAWFNQEIHLENTSNYICLTDWSKKLILEVLSSDNFKIFDIK